MVKRILKIVGWFLLVICVLFVGLILYVRSVAKTDPPQTSSLAILNEKAVQLDSGLSVIGNNWFRKSESGLYELYVEGAPFERGAIAGLLTKDLIQYQEKVFNDQIEQIVPSGLWRQSLRYFIGWFNRDLDDNVSEEYKLEIYGMSQASSNDYNHIAPAYQRLLNYHAAHDIGHALQNMSLVGCTSFATWGSRSADSSLIIGRNFDFYVGDEFARNKIVAFYKPESGYKFMMITFGGMTGVLSGMNDAGLTVTINAAKSDVPSSSATPVSLVAREILQYASTIDEAFVIAEKRKMFVSESFLIGSAKDGRASVIEKTTDAIGRYNGQENYIVCTNHFQSETLANTELNIQHMETSASPYRSQRVEELLSRIPKNTVEKTSAILRDQRGLKDADIGMGNEKTINQLIAHHGIIFQPEKKLVWISTAPWQLGKFVCYDLNKIFNIKMNSNVEIYEDVLAIPADSFLLTKQYRDFTKIAEYRFVFSAHKSMNPDSVVHWNPSWYYSYMLAGDHYYKNEQYEHAIQAYKTALTKEIATAGERSHIKKYLQLSKEKIQ